VIHTKGPAAAKSHGSGDGRPQGRHPPLHHASPSRTGARPEPLGCRRGASGRSATLSATELDAAIELIDAIEAADAAPRDAPPPADRLINAWIDDAVRSGVRRVLCINVGRAVARSLVPPAAAAVPDADVRVMRDGDSWLARLAFTCSGSGSGGRQAPPRSRPAARASVNRPA
jgi:hypothetical protein